MPRISILLPARNAAATLPAALRSIRRQTFKDWELVAVDDGSTDRTPELLEGTTLISTSGVGLVEALRRAAAVASAPLLARMDADDLMHPRRLELQLEGMKDVDVLATRVRTRAAEGMRRYVAWQNGLLTHEQITGAMFVESPIVHPSVLMRRTSFDRAGGYRDAGWAEDYDLWQRLRESGARFGKRPETLLAWRDSPGRLTRTHPMYAEKAFYAAKLHYFLRHPLSRGPLVVWGAGPIGRAWMRDLKAAGREVAAAIDIDPKKIGRVVAGGVGVVAPEAGLSRGVILGAVGSRGARDLIRARLVEAGLVEARDFLFVA
ncbi:MAG TPA: glycosyltransferase family 2 protein [Planctomycetota bacterium]